MNEKLDGNSILVVNKSDLGIENLQKLDFKINPIIISIKENYNVDKVIEAIKYKLKKQFLKSSDILITRSRHRLHLKECCKHLEVFLEKNNDEFDLAAEDLRLSIRHLGTIVGKVDVEEILGSIFENFVLENKTSHSL